MKPPPAGTSWWQVINSKSWLLHAATQDIPCLTELGFTSKTIIDTELAARLAGYEKVGLGSMVTELLDLELAKEHSASDWSIRPLHPSLLNYAALDVDVLHDLWAEIEKSLNLSPKPNGQMKNLRPCRILSQSLSPRNHGETSQG